MVSLETLERNQKRIETHIESYLRYKERINVPEIFVTKAQQKEVLEIISRCFEELADADQTALLPEVWNGNSDVEKVYYDFPTYPYLFTPKKQELVKKYINHFDELVKLRNLWLSVKEIPIQPKKTKEEVSLEKKQNALKTIDYSHITNMEEWQKKINQLIEETDRMITPRYNKLAEKLIRLNNLYLEFRNTKNSEKLENLEKEFPNWRQEIIRLVNKTDSDIANMVEFWKKEELLDIQFKVQKVLNFDIKTVEVLACENSYKSWKINDKKLEIETILAGGYNIQCLHNRTLVKLSQV